MLMNILKKLGFGVAIALLPVMLFAFGSLVGIFKTVGQPDTIKTALDKSGIYEDAVPSLLKQLNSEERPQESKDRDKVPLDDPKIQAIIQDAFAPDYLKRQVNAFLDGTYAVIQGESKSLDFEINLLEAKTRLADGLGAYAAERLATLPPCTSVAEMDPNNLDPLNATCAPPGIDKTAVSQKVRNEFLNNEEFLKDPVINASDIAKSEGNQTDEKLSHVARLYGLIRALIWITGVLAVLLALAVIFSSVSRRAGIKRAAITFISVGVLGAALAWLGTYVLVRVAGQFAKTSSGAESNVELQARIVDILRLVSADIRNWWIWYGAALVVLGIGALVALKFIKPKGATTELEEKKIQEASTEPEGKKPGKIDADNAKKPPTVLS